jgi:hypothetical protein
MLAGIVVINILFLSTDLCLLVFNSLISVLLLLIGFVHTKINFYLLKGHLLNILGRKKEGINRGQVL